jgi:hypothetical protein
MVKDKKQVGKVKEMRTKQVVQRQAVSLTKFPVTKQTKISRQPRSPPAGARTTNVEAILQLILPYKAPRSIVAFFTKNSSESLITALCALLQEFTTGTHQLKEHIKLQVKLATLKDVHKLFNLSLRWTIRKSILYKNWTLLFKIIQLVYNSNQENRVVVSKNATNTSTAGVATDNVTPEKDEDTGSSDSNN